MRKYQRSLSKHSDHESFVWGDSNYQQFMFVQNLCLASICHLWINTWYIMTIKFWDNIGQDSGNQLPYRYKNASHLITKVTKTCHHASYFDNAWFPVKTTAAVDMLWKASPVPLFTPAVQNRKLPRMLDKSHHMSILMVFKGLLGDKAYANIFIVCVYIVSYCRRLT